MKLVFKSVPKISYIGIYSKIGGIKILKLKLNTIVHDFHKMAEHTLKILQQMLQDF